MNLDRLLEICGKVLRALAVLCKIMFVFMAIAALALILLSWFLSSTGSFLGQEIPPDVNLYSLMTGFTLLLILLPLWFYVWSRIYRNGSRIFTIFRESRSHGLIGLSPVLIDLKKLFLYSFALDLGVRLDDLLLWPLDEMQEPSSWQVHYIIGNIDVFLPVLGGSSALLAAFFCYLWARVLEQYNSMKQELETVV